jgi:hypothetical protein
MVIAFKDLTSSRFTASVGQLPGCQLLNDKSKPGLFIKRDNLKLAGWKGTEKDGEAYTHTYNSGNQEEGVHFAEPKLHVILKSPRFVERTQKAQEVNEDDEGYGKQGEIIANYETPEGKEIHNKLKERGLTTLRSFYLIYVCGEDGKNLHPIPFILSIHGACANFFGKAFQAFNRVSEVVYSHKITGDDNSWQPLSQEIHAITYFQPKFGWEMVGATKKSPVCNVASFQEPTLETVESFFALPKAEGIWRIQKSSGNFAAKYMEQAASKYGVHQLAGAFDTQAILPGTVQEFEDDDQEAAIDVKAEAVPDTQTRTKGKNTKAAQLDQSF